ncbi:GNAT family N-acetyltransferase [Haloferax mediterranei ATCC 33500]|uniref:GCN5 family acetyltransferase n=1 Tax=Haloferax mediterranei (strain ATCC 33500 / DSM 1411 / JCM 8866 / NBRC 14739 / NCIMB 2177 / R-4) TaxID=523841 RepID=I3R5S3_HALMT|nr:GNAT family N-acetyltransferase [Haloferax mediterranei]AFK19583.1 GCN5-related N-acetyltransferase [Haloferax mediterranei ATCC 33500]AHZ22975.1 GCN5 family acetyltransferase [Haloferax mediterranei ATCC 33500]ELZ99903.1 N-acetyltransferase GCN5 [Haloferax mediterranei ATCC 33500]MDX5987676.1 GNAT family N-acetyltransferase [Haloferax mediterranei ATCC 33500]QCQ74160.1 GNAT family N-acetyltransferase [Haloferax mediterranei ATCC 33500]
MSPRTYSNAVADPYEAPPLSFADKEDRIIEIRAYDGTDEELEALVEMYDAFDPSDRAQGIPPGREDRIRDWLDNILDDDCLNVIAWNGDEVAGHATLVPDGDAYELAIFVHQTYQRAGIGTRLIKALLGHGRESDVEKVWLTVERWNRAAVGLYKTVGFETSDTESFELEMTIRLTEPGEDA